MQIDQNSPFLSYELTAQEEIAAYTYTELQLIGIKNQIALAAQDVLNPPLNIDDTDITEIKKKAMLRGEIEALTQLLNKHAAIQFQLSEQSNEGN